MASESSRNRRTFKSRSLPMSSRRKLRRTFEPLEERLAMSTFSVVNTNDSGLGSLRQAITDANATPGADLIAFDIAGGGVQTIAPLSDLPTITDPVTIDGQTQPGFAGSPIIELNGENAASASGLVITAGNSTVRGLVINRFQFAGGFLLDGKGNGIVLSTNGGNVVEGNYIGTDVSGTVGLGNHRLGVLIFGGSSGNRIGTNGDGVNDDAERNVISANGTLGNTSSGAGLLIAGTHNNVVAGNYIGTDATGTLALGNTNGGVGLQAGAQGNRVGTDASNDDDPATPLVVEDFNVNERNIISGNNNGGVGIAQAGTNNNTVTGNYIGVGIDPNDPAATVPLGNERIGVSIFTGAQGNQIGGAAAVLGNTIAFHGEVGVLVRDRGADGTTGNRIQGNSIHSNIGLGIDLAPAPFPGGMGVSPNDLGDADFGPNDLQNFPVVAVAHSGSRTFVAGTLNSLPNTVFTLDFYASPAEDADPSGYGEGARYLGSATWATDGSGNLANGSFQVLLDAVTTAEEVITATATDPDGNTSEFSLATAVTSLIVTGTIADESYVFGRHESGAIEVFVFGVSQGIAAQVFVNDPDGQDSYTVNFGGWDGFVAINDQGSFIDDSLTVNGTLDADVIVKVADQVTFGSPVTATVFYGGIENVVVDGSFGNDTIIDPGENTTILGGPGDDTIIIDATFGNGVVVNGGDGSDSYVILFGSLAGPVTVADSGTTGVDSLTALGTSAADAFVLNGGQVQNGAETILIASPVASLAVEGGGGADTTTIDAFTAPISNLTVDGSGGTNAVTIVGDPPAGVNLEIVAAVQTVEINARPKKEPNKINLASQGLIPVVVYTTASFNAALVDVSTVEFAGAHAVHHALKDVDHDGDLDLVLKFRTQDTHLLQIYEELLAEDDLIINGRLDCNVDKHQQASVALSGQTLDGRQFIGFDELDLFLSGKELRKLLKELAAAGAI